MPIYTKTGDRGTSQFGNGSRVRKDDVRLEALGSLDELNCAIGMAHGKDGKTDAQLEAIQSDLLLAGAALAGTMDGERAMKKLEARTAEIEKDIDEIEAKLPALKNFILPGGSGESGKLHWCRAMARRAERRVVEANFGVVADRMLPYFNRLSSYFFVRARLANAQAKVDDRIWKKD